MGLHRAAAVAVALAASLAASRALAGEVTGVVQLEGEPPAPTILDLASMAKPDAVSGCGALTKASPAALVASDGGIQHAVVWIEGSFADEALPTDSPSVLDQRDCQFVPHVLLVPRGTTPRVRNSDSVQHNVRLFDGSALALHTWQGIGAEDLPISLQRPGRYLIRCGVHPWMHAWVVVAEHAYYALTDAEGRFTLMDVPAGAQTLRVWHEVFGERRQPLEVTNGSVSVAVRLINEKGAE